MKEVVIKEAVVQYECEGCGTRYDDATACKTCEDTHNTNEFKALIEAAAGIPEIPSIAASYEPNVKWPTEISFYDDKLMTHVKYRRVTTL